MLYRRLIQDRATGLYFDGAAGWTEKPDLAQDYKTSSDAIQATRHLDRKTLDLVLKFADSRMDVRHPLAGVDSRADGSLPGNLTPAIITALFPSTAVAIQVVHRCVS